jgi:hypothetical protein
VWVDIATVNAATDQTRITMYYGNPSAIARSPQATWSSDFIGVYHFADGTRDATANAIDAVPTGVGYGTGPLDRGLELVVGGAAQYAQIPYQPVLDEVRTLSGWVRIDIVPTTNFAAMLDRTIDLAGLNSEYLGATNGTFYFETVNTTNMGFSSANSPVTGGQWTHLALVLGAPSLAYVDGVQSGTLATPGGVLRPATRYIIGADCTSCTTMQPPFADLLQGGIDEIRLERVARSPLWIDAQVASMRDTLLIYE